MLNSILILDRVSLFAHALAFTCEYRLVDREAVALDREDAAVSWYAVADCNRDDIAGDKLIRLDAFDVTASYYFCLVRRVLL